MTTRYSLTVYCQNCCALEEDFLGEGSDESGHAQCYRHFCMHDCYVLMLCIHCLFKLSVMLAG